MHLYVYRANLPPPSLLVGDDVYKHMLNPSLRYSARLKLEFANGRHWYMYPKF